MSCGREILAGILRPGNAGVNNAEDISLCELAASAIPTTFIWGTDAPYLSAEHAWASIDQIPTAAFHEPPGGHGLRLVDVRPGADVAPTATYQYLLDATGAHPERIALRPRLHLYASCELSTRLASPNKDVYRHASVQRMSQLRRQLCAPR